MRFYLTAIVHITPILLRALLMNIQMQVLIMNTNAVRILILRVIRRCRLNLNCGRSEFMLIRKPDISLHFRKIGLGGFISTIQILGIYQLFFTVRVKPDQCCLLQKDLMAMDCICFQYVPKVKLRILICLTVIR